MEETSQKAVVWKFPMRMLAAASVCVIGAQVTGSCVVARPRTAGSGEASITSCRDLQDRYESCSYKRVSSRMKFEHRCSSQFGPRDLPKFDGLECPAIVEVGETLLAWPLSSNAQLVEDTNCANLCEGAQQCQQQRSLDLDACVSDCLAGDEIVWASSYADSMGTASCQNVASALEKHKISLRPSAPPDSPDNKSSYEGKDQLKQPQGSGSGTQGSVGQPALTPPQQAGVLLREGAALFNQGKLPEAETKLRAAYGLYRHEKYAANLCLVLEANGKHDEALGICEEVFALTRPKQNHKASGYPNNTKFFFPLTKEQTKWRLVARGIIGKVMLARGKALRILEKESKEAKELSCFCSIPVANLANEAEQFCVLPTRDDQTGCMDLPQRPQRAADGSVIRNGAHREYFENGKVKVWGLWKNNLREGFWFSYHPNGKMNTRGGYAGDKKVGNWVVLDAAGTVTSDEEYQNGIKLTGADEQKARAERIRAEKKAEAEKRKAAAALAAEKKLEAKLEAKRIAAAEKAASCVVPGGMMTNYPSFAGTLYIQGHPADTSVRIRDDGGLMGKRKRKYTVYAEVVAPAEISKSTATRVAKRVVTKFLSTQSFRASNFRYYCGGGGYHLIRLVFKGGR